MQASDAMMVCVINRQLSLCWFSFQQDLGLPGKTRDRQRDFFFTPPSVFRDKTR